MSAQPSPDVERLLEHTAFLRRVARGLLSNPEDVEDLTQETWLRAVRARPDGSLRHPRGWLRTIARNLAFGRARSAATRARHVPHLPRPAFEPSTLDVLAHEEMRRRVVRAVLALPEPYRYTLILRYYEGLSLRDTAARMEVPLETVRTRVRRALGRLRAALDEEGERRGEGGGWRAVLLLLSGDAAPGRPAPVAAETGAAGTGAATGILFAIGTVVLGVVAWGLLALGSSDPGLDSETGPHANRARSSRDATAPAPPVLHGHGVLASATPVAVGADGREETRPPPGALQVRDMLDGSACPGGARVRWLQEDRLDGRALEYAADARGRVRVEAGREAARGGLGDVEWLAVGGATSGGVLWALRIVEVRVEVVEEADGRLIDGASVSARRIDSRDAARYRPAGLGEEMHRRAFDLVSGPPVPRGDHHVLTLPRLRGVMVRASAPGRLDAWQLLEPSRLGPGRIVRLPLRPAPTLRGRIRGPQGGPPGGADVLVRIVVVAPRARAEVEHLMFGVSWGCYVVRGAGASHMRFEREIETDDGGAFEVGLPLEGEVAVRAWTDRHVPVERYLGRLPVGPTDIRLDLTAVRGPVPTHAVLRTHTGLPAVRGGATTYVLKVEEGSVTRVWALDVEAPGLPVAELERGARYVVRRGSQIHGEFLGQFVWDEATPIVLEE